MIGVRRVPSIFNINSCREWFQNSLNFCIEWHTWLAATMKVVRSNLNRWLPFSRVPQQIAVVHFQHHLNVRGSRSQQGRPEVLKVDQSTYVYVCLYAIVWSANVRARKWRSRQPEKTNRVICILFALNSSFHVVDQFLLYCFLLFFIHSHNLLFNEIVCIITIHMRVL